MEHLHDLGPARPPRRELAPGARLRLVADRERWQRPEDELGVVRADAEADAHVAPLMR